jgi:phage-related minor tail protein
MTRPYRVELQGSDQGLLVTLRITEAALQRNERAYGTLAQQMARASGVGTAFTQAAGAQGRSADALADHLIQAAQASQRFGAEQERSAAASQRAAELQQRAAQAAARARANAGEATELGGIPPEQRLAALTGLHLAAQDRERAHQAALGNIREAGLQRERQQYRAQQAFLASLNKIVIADDAARSGKGARAALLELQAAQLGVTAQAAPMIARLAESDRRLQSFNKTGRLTALELQQVSFQLNDLGVQLASGQNPLTALIQQGSQLSGTFGGIRPAISAVASLITPARVAVGGLAVGVTALTAAWLQGYRESRQFADSVVLTGNYAGVTAGRMNELARSIAGVSARPLGDVREALQAVVSAARFGPENVERITTAVVSLQRFTGRAADEIVNDLSRIADDPARAAADLNRQYNFLTPQVYAQVRALQEQGRSQEAVGLVADALNAKFAGQRQNLGLLERAWVSFAATARDAWNNLKSIGRDTTVDDRIAALRAQLETPIVSAEFGGLSEAARAQAAAQLAALEAEKKAGDEKAKSDAERSRANQEAIAALDRIQATTRSVETQQEKLNRALREYRLEVERVRTATPNAPEVQPKEVARVEAGLRKQFAERPDRRGASEARALRKAELDEALRELQDANTRERDALSQHQQLLEGRYQAGEISLADYYAQRDRVQAEATQRSAERYAEQLSLLARFQDESAKAGDKVQAAQAGKQITALLGEQARLEEAAAARRQLDARASAEAYAQQVRAVAEFKASIVALTGDERELARVRREEQVRQATLLLSQAAEDPAEIARRVQRYRELLQAQDDLREVQQRASLVSARAATDEERFVLASEARGASLQEIDRGVYEIRARMVEQLGEMTDAAQRLAQVSGDPAAIQQANELGLAYERALRSVDPAIDRLREGLRGLADSTADTIGSAIADFRSLSDIGNAVIDDLRRFLIEQTITAPLRQSLRGLAEQAVPGVARQLGVGSAAGGGLGALPQAAAGASTSVSSMATAADQATAALQRLAGSRGAPVPGLSPSGASNPLGVFAFDTSDAGAPAQPSAERDALRRIEGGAIESIEAAARAAGEFGNRVGSTTPAVDVMRSVTDRAARALSQLPPGVQELFGNLGDVLGDVFSGLSGGNLFSPIGSFFGFARGGAFGPGASAFNPGTALQRRAVTAFAKGGAFTNQLVTRPTPFRFASGGRLEQGLMGEAGPEAVVPLVRASDGSLGVRTVVERASAPIAGTVDTWASSRVAEMVSAITAAAERAAPGQPAAQGVASAGAVRQADSDLRPVQGAQRALPAGAAAGGSAAVGAGQAAEGATPAPLEVHLNLINAPAQAHVKQARRRPGGGLELDVVFEQVRERLGREIDNDTGLARNINGRYGLNSGAALIR